LTNEEDDSFWDEARGALHFLVRQTYELELDGDA